MAAAVCTYVFAPWYYLPKLMPEENQTTADKIRRGGRYLFGFIGLAGGCTAGYFAAAPTYLSASKAEAKATDATTPDGTPLKDASVTTADKAGGGIAATVVFYFVASHITVATVAVGGLLTDCAVGGIECCGSAIKSCCKTSAAKCYGLFTSCCSSRPNKNAARDVRMEKPQLPPGAQRV